MSPDKTKQLVAIFPEMFENPSRLSPIALFGIECDDGWFDLLHELLSTIKAICVDRPSARPKVFQIKEKFGSLRFYYDLISLENDDLSGDGIDNEIDLAVLRAEDRSELECECCGKPSTITAKSYWLSNRCDECCTTNDKQII